MSGIYARYAPVLERLLSDRGGRRYFWVSKHREVGKFIEGARLRPVEPKHLMNGFAAASAAMEPITEEENPFIARYFPGIPVPHLHWAGQIFLLPQEKLEEFTMPLISAAKERLANAGQVSLDAAISASNLADQLPQR